MTFTFVIGLLSQYLRVILTITCFYVVSLCIWQISEEAFINHW